MLKINGLISGYGSVQILNGANMKVDAQSIVALLGGNGTGKSTILKACSGLIRSWSGSISFNGEEIHNNPPPSQSTNTRVKFRNHNVKFIALSCRPRI